MMSGRLIGDKKITGVLGLSIDAKLSLLEFFKLKR